MVQWATNVGQGGWGLCSRKVVEFDLVYSVAVLCIRICLATEYAFDHVTKYQVVIRILTWQYVPSHLEYPVHLMSASISKRLGTYTTISNSWNAADRGSPNFDHGLVWKYQQHNWLIIWLVVRNI